MLGCALPPAKNQIHKNTKTQSERNEKKQARKVAQRTLLKRLRLSVAELLVFISSYTYMYPSMTITVVYYLGTVWC